MPTFWIVSRDFYWGEALRDTLSHKFPGSEVSTLYRSYHFEGLIAGDAKPDFIISDGTCKHRNEYGESEGIYYDEPLVYAWEHSIPCCYASCRWWLSLKLAYWRWRYRSRFSSHALSI